MGESGREREGRGREGREGREGKGREGEERRGQRRREGERNPLPSAATPPGLQIGRTVLKSRSRRLPVRNLVEG